MSAPRVGRLQLANLRTLLSERDMAIVRNVAELRLMSTRQIERLHFPATSHTALGAARAARRVLARLTDHRVLARLERRVGGERAGSAGFVYCLGTIGHRLVRAASLRRRAVEPSRLFVAHTLAVAELVVCLTEAGRDGRLELVELLAEPRCWRRFNGADGSPDVLRPDLRLTIGTGDLERHWYVEVDRGTEHEPAVLRKCRQYAADFRSGATQAAIGLYPKVAWLTTSEKRADWLAAAIARHHDLPPALFAVRPLSEGVALLADGGSP